MLKHKNMDQTPRSPITTAAIMVAVAMVIGASIFSWSFYRSRTTADTLTVTGSARTTVMSNSGKWIGSFSRTVDINDLKSGYAQMATDLRAVSRYLADKGIDPKNITISPVFMNQDYSYKLEQTPRQYTLMQNVEVNLDDVNKINAIANDSNQLINNGVLFSTQAPQFFYNKLAETRISLLGDAVKDARSRAEKIAESGGKNVTNLKEASVGVTQVLSKNSVDVSDYGTYDTSKIEKEITITVKATFNLK